MMREGDWGLFKKLFAIFWAIGMVAYLYGWVDYYILGDQRVGWNSWLLLPLLNAIGQVGLSAAVLAAVCVIGKGLLARAPAPATAEPRGESTGAAPASESSCASPLHDVSSGRATAPISNSGEVPMYFRRPLHNLSGVLRPLPTQRYIMMTMGGYWPVIDKLHNGHLGVVTRDSDFHVGERGRLIFVHSPDGGESWSHSIVISQEGSDNRNPAFGVTSKGTLLASFIKQVNYTEGRYDVVKAQPTPLYVSRSDDHGLTWTTDAANVDGGELIVSSPFGKMITRDDGGFMMTYYVGGTVYHITSRDDGLTWTTPTVIAEGGYNETALCNLGGGGILAVMRGDEEGSLSQVRSEDDGATWSEPEQLTGPTEHPGDVIRLQDGRLLLTYGRRTTPFGILGLVSRDDGRTWDTDNRLLLVADSGNDQGYPSNIQRDDGAIVTVYYSDMHIARRRPRPEIIGIHGAAVIYRPEDLP